MKCVIGQYRLWYRHSGQPDIGRIPRLAACRLMTEKEIAADVGDNDITHMYADGLIPPLDYISPRLVHLRMYNIYIPSQIEMYILLYAIQHFRFM